MAAAPRWPPLPPAARSSMPGTIAARQSLTQPNPPAALFFPSLPPSRRRPEKPEIIRCPFGHHPRRAASPHQLEPLAIDLASTASHVFTFASTSAAHLCFVTVAYRRSTMSCSTSRPCRHISPLLLFVPTRDASSIDATPKLLTRFLAAQHHHHPSHLHPHQSRPWPSAFSLIFACHSRQATAPLSCYQPEINHRLVFSPLLWPPMLPSPSPHHAVLQAANATTIFRTMAFYPITSSLLCPILTISSCHRHYPQLIIIADHLPALHPSFPP